MNTTPEPAPDTSWVTTTCGNCGDGKHWRGYCHPWFQVPAMVISWGLVLAFAVLLVVLGVRAL
jgi:hypothetical protein